MQAWVIRHPVSPQTGVFRYLQCEITQTVSTVLLGYSIRDDAQLANAVLLDLLRGSWVSLPLQIVTHDFCDDQVLDALVSRNMIVDPRVQPVVLGGCSVVFPEEFRLSEQMASSNGRYIAAVRALKSASCALQVITVDNVVCCSLPLPITLPDVPYCVIRQDVVSERLVCVRVGDNPETEDRVIWTFTDSPKMKSVSLWNLSCFSRSSMDQPLMNSSQMLVLTDCGDLEIRRRQRDGSSSVIWSLRSRLIT